MVLDQLNKFLKPHNLFFPVDPSTASRATIGGMAGNNSCGTRSLRYGNMVHNVHAIKAVLSTGEEIEFGPVRGDLNKVGGPPKYRELVMKMRDLYAHEKAEIEARFPKLLRRVAGYNIDMMSDTGFNMAHLLVGSEGTLAYFTALELDLQPVLVHKVVGRLSLSEVLRCDGIEPAHREARSVRGGTGRSHDDRAGAGDSGLARFRREVREG